MTFLQKHLPELSFFPAMFGPVYPHRLYKNYHYTDSLREIMHLTRCSWVVERIFALQLNERGRFNERIQHWELKVLPDGSVMFSCCDEKGRVVYYEHGFADQIPATDLSFVLYHNILHVKN